MFSKVFIMVLGVLGVATTTIGNTSNFLSRDIFDKPSTEHVTVSPATTPAKTTPSPKKPEVAKQPAPVKVTKTQPSTSATKPPTAEPTVKVVDFEKISKDTRSAIVNIFCTSKSGGFFEPLSGSGVIIDPKGIILTNAHIAQFLLLKDYGAENFLQCVARTGSPAVAKYNLKIVYISPNWLNANYKQIASENQTGTGEDDFALLQIVSSTDPDISISQPYPYMNIETVDSSKVVNSPVALVAYPAGFLGGIAIQRDLYMASSIAKVNKVYTFQDGTLDIVSMSGSIIAQQGSSGGAVVNSDGKLIGIISTYVNATNTDNRELDAITLSYINRTFIKNNGQSIKSLLNSDIETFSNSFNTNTVPALKNLLIGELNRKESSN